MKLRNFHKAAQTHQPLQTKQIAVPTSRTYL